MAWPLRKMLAIFSCKMLFKKLEINIFLAIFKFLERFLQSNCKILIWKYFHSKTFANFTKLRNLFYLKVKSVKVYLKIKLLYLNLILNLFFGRRWFQRKIFYFAKLIIFRKNCGYFLSCRPAKFRITFNSYKTFKTKNAPKNKISAEKNGRNVASVI